MIGDGCAVIINNAVKGISSYECPSPPPSPHKFTMQSPPPNWATGDDACGQCAQHYHPGGNTHFWEIGEADGIRRTIEAQCNTSYNWMQGQGTTPGWEYYLLWVLSLIALVSSVIVLITSFFKDLSSLYGVIFNFASVIFALLGNSLKNKQNDPFEKYNQTINTLPDSGPLTAGHIITTDTALKNLKQGGDLIYDDYFIIISALNTLVILVISVISISSIGGSEDPGTDASAPRKSDGGSTQDDRGTENVTINPTGPDAEVTGVQGGGKRNILPKNILPKTLKKFNKWLIIFLLVLAILINYFYNSNRSTMHKKNYIQEMKKERSRNNIQVKEENKNLSYEPSIVFGGQFV